MKLVRKIKQLINWLKVRSNIILGQILTFADKKNIKNEKSKFIIWLKTQYQALKAWIMNHPFVFLYLILALVYATGLVLSKLIYGQWLPPGVKYNLWRIKNSLINAGFLKDNRPEKIKTETAKVVSKKIEEKLQEAEKVIPKPVKVDTNLLNKHFDYKKWRDDNKVPSPKYFADKKAKKK